MNKITEVFESKNSNYSSTEVERALKLAEEALNAMLTHMGMDEDEWTKPTFDQSRKTLAAIREALAQPVKQEPVAVISESAIGLVKLHSNGVCLPFGTQLYAAPVSVEAIRSEALEEAAELCDRFAKRQMHPAECAAAIRGLK